MALVPHWMMEVEVAQTDNELCLIRYLGGLCPAPQDLNHLLQPFLGHSVIVYIYYWNPTMFCAKLDHCHVCSFEVNSQPGIHG